MRRLLGEVYENVYTSISRYCTHLANSWLNCQGKYKVNGKNAVSFCETVVPVRDWCVSVWGREILQSTWRQMIYVLAVISNYGSITWYDRVWTTL